MIVLVPAPGVSQSFYSQHGLGLVKHFVSGQSVGMGGVGLAVADRYSLNYLNPAAVVNLPITFISGHFEHESIGLESQSQDAAISATNVAAVQFHVPLKKERVSLALALVPFSEIEYTFESRGTIGLESFTEVLEGDGGANTAILTVAIRPFQRLTVGASGLFYFGSLRNIWRVQFREGSGLINTRQEVIDNFTSGNIRIGFQFELLKDWRVAGIFSPSITLDANRSVSLVNIKKFSDFPDRDFEVPLTLGFGTSFFLGRKLLIAADYHIKRWSDANIEGYVNDSRMINLGLEFSGRDDRINSSYWSRAAVRAGFYYRDLGLEDPVGQSVTEMFGSVGVGLPIKWRAGRLDLALEFGRRGSIADNPVTEDIIRISATATAGERWFFRGNNR